MDSQKQQYKKEKKKGYSLTKNLSNGYRMKCFVFQGFE